MALIVEDGTQPAGAESYASVAAFTDYVTKRGLTLAAEGDSERQEILLRRAMDFLETLEARFAGTRVSETQALAWPRADVQVNGFDLAENTIPAVLVKALCQLAYDAEKVDLMPRGDGREVTKEKIGPLEFTYAETNSAAPQPSLTAFWALIDPLLSASGGFLLDLAH